MNTGKIKDARGCGVISNHFDKRPDMTDGNFREMLERVAARYPENTALQIRRGPDEYEIWTYQDFHREVVTLGRWLTAEGLEKGDRAGILMENRPEWALVYLAVTCAGFVVVPLDIFADAKTIETYVAFSGLRYLFTSNELESKWRGLIRRKSPFPVLVNVDLEESEAGQVALREARSFKGTGELPELSGSDTASIIFTSGTTGHPKGVMLSHKGILENINASIMSLPIYESDNFIAVLPFHHTYPTTCSLLSPLSVGGTVTVVDKIVGPVIIDNIRETGGTHIIGVPLLFDKIRKGLEGRLMKLPGPKGVLVRTLLKISRGTARWGWKTGKVLLRSVRVGSGLGSIRLMVAGGGPLNRSTGEFFELLGFDLVQGYGMSENGPLITTNTPKYNDFDSVGLMVKNTDVQIRNAGPDGVGEIVVKSPSLMKGYYRNEDASREMFTDDGYLKTGDLGYLDARGFLYITGRNKSVIVSPGGKNIYPEEIESCFSDRPLVAEVLVRGRPLGRGNQGEEVEAVCVPDFEALSALHPEAVNDEEALDRVIRDEVNRVNAGLVPYKRIVHLEVRREGFEKTSSQKIKRFLYQHQAEGVVTNRR
jgi:long-chain acyl-CoA synthetase